MGVSFQFGKLNIFAGNKMKTHMKIYRITVLMALLVAGFSSCKKDDDEEPPSTSYETNRPPESGAYFVGQQANADQTNFYAAWTTDFETYHAFTDQFDNVGSVVVNGNMVMIAEWQDQATALYYIHFASLDNLSDFTTIESIYSPELMAIANGTVVTYSGTFSRTGYCRTGQGETTVTWTSEPADHTISSLKVFDGEVLGKANVAGNSSYVYFTENGTQPNFNTPGYIATSYESIDSETWALNAASWATISSNDWANGIWNVGVLNTITDGNSTSIPGNFMAGNNVMQRVGGEYRVYGYIEEDDGQNITRHACVNISSQQGAANTWTTSLLAEIPEGDAYSIPFSSSTITVLHYQEQTMNEPDYYSSSDGIHFTKWTNPERIANYQLFGSPMMVR